MTGSTATHCCYRSNQHATLTAETEFLFFEVIPSRRVEYGSLCEEGAASFSEFYNGRTPALADGLRFFGKAAAR